MNPFSNLTDENHEQIRKYLKFLRSKKESILRAVGNEFREAKASRLAGETMFSIEDVEQFTDFLAMETRNQVSTDVGNIINMAALTASLLLESAQEKGLDLNLETSAAENQVNTIINTLLYLSYPFFFLNVFLTSYNRHYLKLLIN